VLVVDDNRDAADTLGLMLSAWGHRPLVTYDPAEAWELAVTYRPDVGLLDIGLPGTSGWDLARRLRAEPSLAGMRLLAVTGYGTDRDRERSDEAGMDWHLVKPTDPDLLRRLLVVCGLRRGRPWEG
jgi:DNA-binding response OmpR family regulator